MFKHLRQLGCELKAMGVCVAFIFADDKCSAKIGEPGDPIAAIERNKRVVGSAELGAIASRHNFAKFKVNPSVILLLAGDDIPNSVLESFYRGSVYVSVKDAVFQPSFPLRHSAEIMKVLEETKLVDDLQVLLLYADGGPAHNITFMTVVMALLCLFLTGDLDFLIAAQTCPQQSWNFLCAFETLPCTALHWFEKACLMRWKRGVKQQSKAWQVSEQHPSRTQWSISRGSKRLRPKVAL